MNEHRIDRKATRLQVSAEQARITEETRVRLKHEREQLRLQRERQQLILDEEKQQARANAKAKRRIQRQNARQKLAARIQALMPTVGQRVMIAGPILAPMAVAWVGQIQFADKTLGWPLIACLVFAAAWELTTAFSGWMFHQAQKNGDRGTLFRVATWIFATSAGAMNYWHACPVDKTWTPAGGFKTAIDLAPTPKAISYGAMSLVGIALWELYSSLIHRKHLREQGIVSGARPRFGILRWVRFPRITWTAWSLSVRYGIKTVDEAWTAAVKEIARRDHAKAVAAERKRLAKDKRPVVRVVVARTVVRPVVSPKTKVRLFWTDHSATILTATIDRPDATTGRRPVATTDHMAVATTTARSLPAPATTPEATGDQADATTNSDHPTDRTRPQRKTTRKTGRDQVDATTKPQPTADDNQRAVTAYLASVKSGRPLSKRALAKQFGFSPTWALARIQEAGPRPVGGGDRPVDQVDATTPKDHPTTSEVKTG